jgi:hypothetical protein
MKLTLLITLFLSSAINAFAQKTDKDSTEDKEGIAVVEIGGASSTDLKSGKSSFGYNVSVETTPIENWLEVELGISPTYAAHSRETDIDLLFKKPWTFSNELEFMVGIGPDWAHSTDEGIATNSWSGELALDFMYWPFKKHQFGFYAEPAYDYGFEKGHEQSIDMSAGVIINIP